MLFRSQEEIRDDGRIEIIPEYGRQKLLTYAESFRDLADLFEEDEEREQVPEPSDRQAYLWQKKLQENQGLLAEHLKEMAHIMARVARETCRCSNLVQTLENTPALMHGGPFANIAHGCNSVTATKLGLKLADYCITEAGFGADLGAEKFLDIKCRFAGFKPDCIVLVATIRALKYNGGVPKAELGTENVAALKKGIVNLQTHIENMQKYGVPAVVAINRFGTDTEAEIAVIEEFCAKMGVEVSLTEVFAKGGAGGTDLAQKVCKTIAEKPSNYRPLYDTDLTIPEKLEIIAKEIYRADGVTFTAAAKKSLAEIEALGKDKLPVCVAKTQYSLSDNPALLGKPEGFTLTVRDVRLSAGAGFVVALTGDIMTMPGLPKVPAASKIDVDADGNISGLF